MALSASKKALIATFAVIGAYPLYLAATNTYLLWQRAGNFVPMQAVLDSCAIKKIEGGFNGQFFYDTQFVGELNYILPEGNVIKVTWHGIDSPPSALCKAGAKAQLMVLNRNPSLAFIADQPASKGPGLLLTTLVQAVLGLLIVRAAGLELAKRAV